MLAGMMQIEELEIDGEEGELLATRTAAVLSHYPNVPISPKTMDFIGLFMALGQVYGPRVVSVRLRRSTERAKTVSKPAPVGASGPIPQPANTIKPGMPSNTVPDPYNPPGGKGASMAAPPGYMPGSGGVPLPKTA